MQLRVHGLSVVLMLGIIIPGAVLTSCSAEPQSSPEVTATAAEAIEQADTVVEEVAPTTGASIVEAARAGLPTFLASIGQGDEASFGFNSRAEFAEVTFGEPYEWFLLDDDVQVTASKRWSVPLLVQGRTACLLEVKQVGDTYQAVAIGSALFADELAKIEAARKARDSKRAISRRSILRSWKEKADFVVFDAHPTAERAKARAVFTHSAHMALAPRVVKLAAHKPAIAAAARARTGFDMDQLASLMRK